MATGPQLKALRIVKGMTLAQVGAAIGDNAGNVSRYENGKVGRSPGYMAKYLTAIGYSGFTIRITEEPTEELAMLHTTERPDLAGGQSFKTNQV